MGLQSSSAITLDLGLWNLYVILVITYFQKVHLNWRYSDHGDSMGYEIATKILYSVASKHIVGFVWIHV